MVGVVGDDGMSSDSSSQSSSGEGCGEREQGERDGEEWRSIGVFGGDEE